MEGGAVRVGVGQPDYDLYPDYLPRHVLMSHRGTSKKGYTQSMDSECIEWEKATYRNGYGSQRKGGKQGYAHRFAWEDANGPIPEGMVIMHLCDNRRCVNVLHLRLGTHADNIRDMFAKGRNRNGNESKSRCPAGHAYDDANTRHYQGSRSCRECNRIRLAKRRSAIGQTRSASSPAI